MRKVDNFLDIMFEQVTFCSHAVQACRIMVADSYTICVRIKQMGCTQIHVIISTKMKVKWTSVLRKVENFDIIISKCFKYF